MADAHYKVAAKCNPARIVWRWHLPETGEVVWYGDRRNRLGDRTQQPPRICPRLIAMPWYIQRRTAKNHIETVGEVDNRKEAYQMAAELGSLDKMSRYYVQKVACKAYREADPSPLRGAKSPSYT